MPESENGANPERAGDKAAGQKQDTGTRRVFLQVGALALCGGTCALTAIPGLQMVAHPLSKDTVTGPGQFIAAGSAIEFVEGQPVKVDIVTERHDGWNRIARAKIGSAWVVRRSGTILAYSTACPHLGCSVDMMNEAELETRRSGFVCRCHDSYFAADGSATDGPSPRGLDELEVREVDGHIEILFQRFRYGSSTKTPV